MPQDPNLYGQRPAKKQKKEIPLSSSLAFTSQLTSLMSTPSSSATTNASSGRVRPSKTKDDIFSVKAKRKPGGKKSKDALAEEEEDSRSTALKLRDVHGTEDDKQAFARSRRKMEEKARLYAAMKRGDYVAKEGEGAPLVDFDRMWAEKHPGDEEGQGQGQGRHSSSGSDNESDDDDHGHGDEVVEYKDEFGRTRTGTRAEVSRQQRREARMRLGAAELAQMSARPAPEKVIYGDAIQAAAFDPREEARDRMEALAAKRDRSPTPPEDTHFDGNAEIRTKGVGFYQFSRDNGERAREMEGLAEERRRTERAREEREKEKERRKREIEERRRVIGAKRAQKMAESFLDGLGAEMMAEDGGGGGTAAATIGKGQTKADAGKVEAEDRKPS
ncbi:hypothetical protein F5Y15DRAFT_168432 [Xylariaceae sp. FL0016]|nr:hypothetical protein F5Y15DRAFT_168432 [Xylariaceae sp. FL0016]